MIRKNWTLGVFGITVILILGFLALPTSAGTYNITHSDSIGDVVNEDTSETAVGYDYIDITTIELIDNEDGTVTGEMTLNDNVDEDGSIYTFFIADMDDWENNYIFGTYQDGIGIIWYVPNDISSAVMAGVSVSEDTITYEFDLTGITYNDLDIGGGATYTDDSGAEEIDYTDYAGYMEDLIQGGNGGNGGSSDTDEWSFTFIGSDVNIAGPDDVYYEGTFTIDKSKSPKEIDIEIVDNSIHPDLNGETSLGIYKLDGTKLTLSMSEPGDSNRPTTFTEEENNMVWQLTYFGGPDDGATELEGIWTGIDDYEDASDGENGGGGDKKDDDDDGGGFLPGFEAVFLITAMGLAVIAVSSTARFRK